MYAHMPSLFRCLYDGVADPRVLQSAGVRLSRFILWRVSGIGSVNFACRAPALVARQHVYTEYNATTPQRTLVKFVACVFASNHDALVPTLPVPVDAVWCECDLELDERQSPGRLFYLAAPLAHHISDLRDVVFRFTVGRVWLGIIFEFPFAWTFRRCAGILFFNVLCPIGRNQNAARVLLLVIQVGCESAEHPILQEARGDADGCQVNPIHVVLQIGTAHAAADVFLHECHPRLKFVGHRFCHFHSGFRCNHWETFL